jgi:hypothetical protein
MGATGMFSNIISALPFDNFSGGKFSGIAENIEGALFDDEEDVEEQVQELIDPGTDPDAYVPPSGDPQGATWQGAGSGSSGGSGASGTATGGAGALGQRGAGSNSSNSRKRGLGLRLGGGNY